VSPSLTLRGIAPHDRAGGEFPEGVAITSKEHTESRRDNGTTLSM
jgi:hypothetical protein